MQLLQQTNFENLDTMFVRILLRDLAHDFPIEFESLHHRAIIEIILCMVKKKQWATLNELSTHCINLTYSS